MQMATRAASGISAQAQHLARKNRLSLVEKRSRQVPIDGLQPVRMANHQVVAVPLRVPAHDTHLTIPRSTNRIAHLHLQVRAVVETILAEAVARGNIPRVRQAEPRQINTYAIAQRVNRRIIRIHARARPYMLIEAVRGVLHAHHRRHLLRQQFIETLAIVRYHH